MTPPEPMAQMNIVLAPMDGMCLLCPRPVPRGEQCLLIDAGMGARPICSSCCMQLAVVLVQELPQEFLDIVLESRP